MTEAMLWKAGEAAAATGGRTRGDWSAAGVSIDSRGIKKNDLFIALQGPSFDGHDFLEQAFTAGASAAMVHRTPEDSLSDNPYLLVDDTLGALWRLGAAARSRSKASVIAVTGSAGKTSTKEALRHCLAAQATVSANLASLNNHWGVPLSLSRMAPDVNYGVFELGMNNPGEILELVRLVRPRVVIITNVEAAHIGNFASVAEIADAKAEIFQAVEPGGAAVLNREHPLFHHLRDKAVAAGIERIVGFGRHEDAEVRLISAKRSSESSRLKVEIFGDVYEFLLPLPGEHMIANALAVLAALGLAGADVAKAVQAMESLGAVSGRGAKYIINLSKGGEFVLIDDSYNANPASMRAAFDVLAHCRPEGRGRRIAVLGDMLELGSASERLHGGLAAALKDIDAKVYCCGKHMASLFAALPDKQRVLHAPDSGALADLVAQDLRAGDIVLVKGSLGSRMRVVVEALKALDQPAARAANGH